MLEELARCMGIVEAMSRVVKTSKLIEKVF
jgi:hypothetical protein